MSYDLVIKNGTVVDGTGAKRYQADVAIAAGKVAEIGKVTEGAKRTIDAHGLVVAPGFVDPHTHYDAQICWDGAVTPSSWHGVTSVVMGNCGVGIAPCRPETREIAMRDLVNVEGIPFDVLHQGITWDWETFPQFMDSAARRAPSLNLAFIAPLTPFRHYVMGEASLERAATPEETAKIAALIGEAIDAGALGFSSTTLNQHIGFQGKPLACRNASHEELKAYANALKTRGKGAIEIALTRQVGVLEEDQCELLDFLLTESGRPVTFIALFDRDDIPEAVRDTLRRAAPMIAKGARPQTSPLPLTREINMDNPFSFAAFPSWKRVFADSSKEAQKAVYADPAFRNQFREDLKKPMGFSNWSRIVVHTVRNPALKHLEDKSIAQIAAGQGTVGGDAFLDTVLADNLELELTMASWNTREDRMRELLNNRAILMALGDGGAHVDMLCDAGYPTYLLGTWVREKEAITLEEGVRKLTSDPADLFGLKDRGRLAKEAPADVAIFDPARVGSTNHGERRYDLPGGAKRIVMPSQGVEYTLVNGAITWEQGRLTEAKAGTVLRG
ncbi:amidohydrolase family protein [Vineibacter terrae]|uniref:Amidohydrolase family protein n=1 Tax=Vineibacter terrae TaxID=2586908 RepID=A0A5C8PE63_9HYPH|nr:amidohydrolase family protein [Vineibacter terrae]TXL71439.1 amidohydrolase family protein [Vineibacter terrae]